jgi:hypothetical protein
LLSAQLRVEVVASVHEILTQAVALQSHPLRGLERQFILLSESSKTLPSLDDLDPECDFELLDGCRTRRLRDQTRSRCQSEMALFG